MDQPINPASLPVIPAVSGQPPPSPTVKAPVQPAPKRKLPVWLVGATFIVLVAGLVLFLSSIGSTQKPTVTGQPETPPAASPTPMRTLSPIATQSAFATLQQSVASLSSGLNAYAVQDPSLSPPVLDLPLGF